MHLFFRRILLLYYSLKRGTCKVLYGPPDHPLEIEHEAASNGPISRQQWICATDTHLIRIKQAGSHWIAQYNRIPKMGT